MPQKKSAFKRLRQDKKKHVRNKAKISEIRTLAKKVRMLLAEKNAKEAETTLRRLESKFNKGIRSGVMKRKTASRRISRLRKQLDQIKKKK